MNYNKIQISQSVMIICLIRWFLRSWKYILTLGPRQQFLVVFQYDMGILLRTYYGIRLDPMFSSCWYMSQFDFFRISGKIYLLIYLVSESWHWGVVLSNLTWYSIRNLWNISLSRQFLPGQWKVRGTRDCIPVVYISGTEYWMMLLRAVFSTFHVLPLS